MNVWRLALAAIVVSWSGAALASQPVAFSKVSIRMESGTAWWDARTGILCEDNSPVTWDSPGSKLDPALFAPAFHKALSTAGFAPSNDQDNLFEPQRDEGEFVVGGVISNLAMTTCFNSGLLARANKNIKGRARMDVEWQIYSRLERKVVRRIKTTGSFEEKKPGPYSPIKFVLAAFSANAAALATDQGFRDIFNGQARAPSEVLRPAAQRPIVVANTSGARKIADTAPSVVLILTGDGHGSGVLVSQDGYVLTNEHVVGGSKFVKIRWADGVEGLGEVVRLDRRRDVALIKTDPRGRQPLMIKARTPTAGDTVFAIGAPLDEKFQSTVTRGVVSANRTVDGLNYIQSDVTVNPGNSGGPLLDESGAVVGLTDLGYQPEGLPTNINLFIPIADALTYLALTLQ